MHTAWVSVGLAVGGVLGAVVPVAAAGQAAGRAPQVGDVRIGLIAESTAACLGMPKKTPLKGIPDLTTFTVKDLTRFQTKQADECVQKAGKDPANPVNALIKRLTAPTSPPGPVPGKADSPGSAALRPASALGNRAPGDENPQLALIEASFNKACLGLPAKGKLHDLVDLAPADVQHSPLFAAPATHQCAEKHTADGKEPLLQILENVAVLSNNGTGT
ncbi:hypothetical protein GPA10_09395 [Streptomyces sp. p1417]|uniref:Secreted protein n=2 Tax=Streptomyces typhae TaxID=2681492 RepID=A0A6L6WWY8_9ACTN|nr:hypothetical protein [Streptomyces typhae]